MLLWVLHIILLYLCLTVPYIGVHLRLDNYDELYSTKMMLEISIFQSKQFSDIIRIFFQIELDHTVRQTDVYGACHSSFCLFTHIFGLHLLESLSAYKGSFQRNLILPFYIYIIYVQTSVYLKMCLSAHPQLYTNKAKYAKPGQRQGHRTFANPFEW